MSVLKVTTLQNISGVEVYLEKAWINFNGKGTVAIREGGNVSSITDNATGDYTVNFASALAGASYDVNTGAVKRSDTPLGEFVRIPADRGPTAAGVRIGSTRAYNDGGFNSDADIVSLSINR